MTPSQETTPNDQTDTSTFFTSAVVSGGSTGGALAAFAQTPEEPYRTWCSIASPALAAIVASAWPRIAQRVKSYLDKKDAQRAIAGMKEFVKTQKERLKDRSLSQDAEAGIKARIAAVEEAITERSFSLVASDVNNKRVSAQSQPESSRELDVEDANAT